MHRMTPTPAFFTPPTASAEPWRIGICRNTYATKSGGDKYTSWPALDSRFLEPHNFAPLMSPAHFAEFIAPRLRRMVEVVHEEGALCIKHTDGNLWPILEMIVDAGPDAINPLEPVAGMDIGQVKKQYGARACLVGNIDCGELLSHGTVEQVEEAVRQCIAAAAPGGGFMLSSSNSIHSSVRPENYLAMVRAGQRYGKYPLDMEMLAG